MDSKKLFRIHQGPSEKDLFFASRGVFSLDPPFNGRPPYLSQDSMHQFENFGDTWYVLLNSALLILRWNWA
jgi:hypothetical protein